MPSELPERASEFAENLFVFYPYRQSAPSSVRAGQIPDSHTIFRADTARARPVSVELPIPLPGPNEITHVCPVSDVLV
jgi:hypothetical protein